MGHVQTGRLPKTQRWRAVVGELGQPTIDVPRTAALTLRAAEHRLTHLQGDPALTHCFWLLVRLAAAARGSDFTADLAQLGLAAEPDEATITFVARLSEQTRHTLAELPASGPFGDLASQALRRALMETVGTEGRSLFDSSIADLERAFRRHASDAQFSTLATRFFGDFYARLLRYYIDRELFNVLGGGPRPAIATGQAFHDALDLHARQSAQILDQFATDWYRREFRQQAGMIGKDDAQAFITGAVRKLREEARRELAP